jgi:hypothetical protein
MGFGRYNHQGYFGESFVRVLASAAGLIASAPDLDMTGVDFSINLPGHAGTVRYPKIEVQVKSWCSPRGSDDAWHYPMDVRHFNDLAGDDYIVRRYLFLVIVPDDHQRFAEADVVSLRLRHCGYWVSLANQARLDPTSRASTTVRVPKRNVLTSASLRGLLLDTVPAPRVSP